MERGKHPLIEKKLMQTHLGGGVILGLHDFRIVPFEPRPSGYIPQSVTLTVSFDYHIFSCNILHFLNCKHDYPLNIL